MRNGRYAPALNTPDANVPFLPPTMCHFNTYKALYRFHGRTSSILAQTTLERLNSFSFHVWTKAHCCICGLWRYPFAAAPNVQCHRQTPFAFCFPCFICVSKFALDFWLIDGGPVAPPIFTPRTGKTRKRQAPAPPSWAEGGNRYSSYYQFLQQTLLRFCCSGTQDNKLGFRMIDLLDGIVVTHPHQDHMDGEFSLP